MATIQSAILSFFIFVSKAIALFSACYLLYSIVHFLCLPSAKRISVWIRKNGSIITLGLIDYKTWQEKFQEKGIYACDLTGYLQEFLKLDKSIKPKNYQLRYNYGVNEYNEFDIYFDTIFGFTLIETKKYRPKMILGLAAIGFEVNTKERIVTIRQIQGHPGRKKELQNLRWEKMLIVVVVDWAKQNRFKRVQIQRAKNNKYYLGREKEFHLRYDVTAKRSGFKLDNDKNEYVLNLA